MFWETAVFYGIPDGERTDYINCFQIVQAGQGCVEGDKAGRDTMTAFDG